MTLVELAMLAAEVRAAQRSFFRTWSTGDLERSKDLERALDLAVSYVLKSPSLFASEDRDR